MLPSSWELQLVDRNVGRWDNTLLDWADIVLTGGMLPQRRDCVDVISQARARGKRIVVGGPDATSSPHFYTEANHLVLGEGEITIPEFLADLDAGSPKTIYQNSLMADMQRSPVPRFDLLHFQDYNYVGIQWCRGCPFNCEFCDIIELYGRVPRAKTIDQALRELQTLYDLGYRGRVALVDDNFIGNKKLVKPFLRRLRGWLEEHEWPFEFTTEASINLADDEELMNLMQEVGFFAVFVGIESPDESTLISMQKRQNTRRSIAKSIHKIYRHGMFVAAGYIVGSDDEEEGAAGRIIECIENTAIPVNTVGLLAALPATQLTRRLASEGRLHEDFDVMPEGDGDQCTWGINFVPRRPRVEILRDYLKIVETIYTPGRYFDRVLQTAAMLDSGRRRFRPRWRQRLRESKGILNLVRKLGLHGRTRGPFWRALLGSIWRNPKSVRYAAVMMALYVHLGPFSKYVAQRIREAIAKEELHPSPVASAHPSRHERRRAAVT
jgi:hypothetical protein